MAAHIQHMGQVSPNGIDPIHDAFGHRLFQKIDFTETGGGTITQADMGVIIN